MKPENSGALRRTRLPELSYSKIAALWGYDPTLPRANTLGDARDSLRETTGGVKTSGVPRPGEDAKG